MCCSISSSSFSSPRSIMYRYRTGQSAIQFRSHPEKQTDKHAHTHTHIPRIMHTSFSPNTSALFLDVAVTLTHLFQLRLFNKHGRRQPNVHFARLLAEIQLWRKDSYISRFWQANKKYQRYFHICFIQVINKLDQTLFRSLSKCIQCWDTRLSNFKS